MDKNPHAAPPTQCASQHAGDSDHVCTACNAMGVGLGSGAFRLLVALPGACGAGRGLSRAIVHDSA